MEKDDFSLFVGDFVAAQHIQVVIPAALLSEAHHNVKQRAAADGKREKKRLGV